MTEPLADIAPTSVVPVGAGTPEDSARRRAPLTDVLRTSPGALAFLLVGILGFSILDGLLTTLELEFRIAVEANPVLHALFSLHPLAALGFKLLMTILVILSIWRGRDSRLIVRIALFTFIGYGALIAYHLGSLTGLGFL